MGSHLALLAAATMLTMLLGGGDALPEPLRARLDTIVIDDLKRHATFLTSDDCAGRDTPQVGLEKARDYLVEQHQKFGLESGNSDGTYHYVFEVPAVTWGDGDHLTVTRGAGAQDVVAFEPGVDFVPVRGSGDGNVDAEVVFCGYGIADPEEKYDDFKGADVKDKVVAVLLHEPREGKKGRAFKGEEWTAGGAISRKGRAAREKGAKAVLVFTDPANHKDLSVLKGEHPRYGNRQRERPPADDKQQGADDGPIPVVHASGAVADRLFGAGKLLEWQKAIDQKLAGIPRKVPGVRVKLKVALQEKKLPVQNVIAAKRGVDPVLRDEWIVVGAHYDHVGVDDFGRIFYGADDNASGTSCLLEIAEAIGAPEVAFKRSVMLMHFSAEEKGLLGSEAFCEKPLMPADKMFAMVNMDMVGRGRPHDIDAAGLANSADFQSLMRKAVSQSGARIKVGDGGMEFFQRSDQYHFWKVGVPVLFFMEPKEHEDYHKVTDTMDKLVFPKIAATARAVTGLVWLLSEAEQRPRQEGLKPR